MKMTRLVKKTDGTVNITTYRACCEELGFDPSSRFVVITTRGTISWSLGKPYEIKKLRERAMELGLVCSKKLQEF